MAANYGFQVRITSGYRTYAQQAKLYRDYINGVSHYPANKPGSSSHEKGLALDILSTNNSLLVTLLTNIGLVWAGPNDPIHFQIGPKMAVGGSRTQKVVKPKAKESTLGKILDWTSWIPGPIGWASMVGDIWL